MPHFSGKEPRGAVFWWLHRGKCCDLGVPVADLSLVPDPPADGVFTITEASYFVDVHAEMTANHRHVPVGFFLAVKPLATGVWQPLLNLGAYTCEGEFRILSGFFGYGPQVLLPGDQVAVLAVVPPNELVDHPDLRVKCASVALKFMPVPMPQTMTFAA